MSQQAHAVLRRCTDLLHFAVGPLTREDKELYVNNLSFSAQRHAHSGNIRGTFGIIKALTKHRTRPPPAVKLIDGTIVTDEIQRQERWLEHFCSVYNGRMFKDVALIGAPRESHFCGQICVGSCHVDWSASNLLRVLSRMNPRKGLGPDQIPSNLWAAGGEPIAKHLALLGLQIKRQCTWPSMLKGSRIVDLWKGKGDRMICDFLSCPTQQKCFSSR